VLLTVGWRRTAEQCLVCRAHQHWRMQRTLVCSGCRCRPRLQQLAVAAGRVRGHARAGMRWEETCGACRWGVGVCCVRGPSQGGRKEDCKLWLCCRRDSWFWFSECASAAAGACVVIRDRAGREGVPKRRARSVLDSTSCFSRLRLRQAKRQNGQGCAQAGSGEEVRRPGRLATGQQGRKMWNGGMRPFS